MPNYNFLISDGDRKDVINFIIEQKNKNNFTVVDVGGAISGWSSSVIDALVDFNEYVDNNSLNIKHFKCDITHPDSWHDILKYVEKNGKFDFCICTHTLEDIMNPVFVCEQIAKISKAGYIAVPSKYCELSRFENGYNSYRGYIHHRYIFDIVDTIFMGYPKINYIDSNSVFHKITDLDKNRKDLSFYWIDSVDIKYINNNYLGPDINSVIKYYNSLLDKTV
jgi:hypothetical protein